MQDQAIAMAMAKVQEMDQLGTRMLLPRMARRRALQGRVEQALRLDRSKQHCWQSTDSKLQR